MQLFLIHCGYYERDVLDGIYENHVNLFIAAESVEDARARIRLDPLFKGKKMHIDGVQLLEAVDGYRVSLEKDPKLEGRTVIQGSRSRFGARRPSTQSGG